jgi:LuxR family transcriptional regulator
MRFTDDDLHLLGTGHASVFDYVAGHFRRHGFSFCSYGVRLPVPLAQPRILIQDTYPEAWMKRFDSQGYLAVDPTIAHAFRSDDFVLWSPELFRPAGAMWDDANAHGLKVGWGKPGRRNGMVGMLSLSREADPLSPVEIAAHAADMARMSEMLLVSCASRQIAAEVPESQAILTEREKEVLRWTADGKTAHEIGCILSLSVATINFHINKAVAKLASVNKTQAVVKAALLGLL